MKGNTKRKHSWLGLAVLAVSLLLCAAVIFALLARQQANEQPVGDGEGDLVGLGTNKTLRKLVETDSEAEGILECADMLGRALGAEITYEPFRGDGLVFTVGHMPTMTSTIKRLLRLQHNELRRLYQYETY